MTTLTTKGCAGPDLAEAGPCSEKNVGPLPNIRILSD